MMGEARQRAGRRVVVFDVLGTLVDHRGSLEQLVSAVAGIEREPAANVVRRWLDYVSAQQRAIIDGGRPFAPSHELDLEALYRLVDEGLLPPGAVTGLMDASERLQPWPDTVAGLDDLAADATVIGLSNASRRVLTGLSGSFGLRWHQLLSVEDVRTYKPSQDVYTLALTSVPVQWGTPFMVATHAWDLRGAAAAGMHTAYVARPDGGDPPRQGDTFDVYAIGLQDLRARLLAWPEPT